MPRRTLVCCAFPFGYGPAAKLLHIARRLQRSELRLVFLGTGIAHELVARSSCFDEVLPVAANKERAREVIRSATALLSLMDREYAPVAVELGRPLFVADSLLWMRDPVPPLFRRAQRYWVQNFVGVPERLAEAGPNAALVGPIVAPAGAPGRQGTRVVVNLGGCEAPAGLAGGDPAYFDFVFRVLVDSGLLTAPRCGAVFLAGERCIRYLRERAPGCGLELVSASHEDSMSLMRTARWVITAPGLTACLECFQAGVPTLFLPPQNYSQWWVLKALRRQGLAPGSFHWEDLLPGCSVTERMPEAVRGPLVRDAIRDLTQDGRADQLLREGLASALAGSPHDLAVRQRAFFDSLGPDGTAQIVHDLSGLC
jgi:hypothetical protein